MESLVLLVSDQAIPNLLFIKERNSTANEFIFITTRPMKALGKISNLIKAAALDEKQCREVILYDANDLRSILKAFEKEFPPLGTKNYHVNITCGTKIMFLAAYNYFSKLENSTIYYLPIGRNQIIEMFPAEEMRISDVGYRLNVREYLLAYGIVFNALGENKVLSSHDAEMLFDKFKELHYDINNLVSWAKTDQKKLEQHSKGHWFEHYVYLLLRRQFNFKHGQIETELKIQNLHAQNNDGHANELDVVFVLDNELYVIETKVSVGTQKTKNIGVSIDEALTKLSALNKNFGLRSHPWLVTLSDLITRSDDFRKARERRRKVLGIEGLVDRNNFDCFYDLIISSKKTNGYG